LDYVSKRARHFENKLEIDVYRFLILMKAVLEMGCLRLFDGRPSRSIVPVSFLALASASATPNSDSGTEESATGNTGNSSAVQ
jgi:hypothetical protein